MHLYYKSSRTIANDITMIKLGLLPVIVVHIILQSFLMRAVAVYVDFPGYILLIAGLLKLKGAYGKISTPLTITFTGLVFSIVNIILLFLSPIYNLVIISKVVNYIVIGLDFFLIYILCKCMIQKGMEYKNSDIVISVNTTVFMLWCEVAAIFIFPFHYLVSGEGLLTRLALFLMSGVPMLVMVLVSAEIYRRMVNSLNEFKNMLIADQNK